MDPALDRALIDNVRVATARLCGLAVAVCAGVLHAAAPLPEHVEVVNLRHTTAALEQTAARGKRFSLPKVIVFDSAGKMLFAEVGYEAHIGTRAGNAVKKAQPQESPISLHTVLAETEHADGSSVTVLPKADAYIVDYWAEWCGPCKLVEKSLERAMAEWTDWHVVWIKIESDPMKLPKR